MMPICSILFCAKRGHLSAFEKSWRLISGSLAMDSHRHESLYEVMSRVFWSGVMYGDI